MKSKLLFFLVALAIASPMLRAQTGKNEASSYFTAGMEYSDNKDYAKAFEQFRQGAEQGYADAQNALGVCYYEGEGVAKDLSKAFYWFQKAAEQGDADGQYNLGQCYYDGEGVDKDMVQALKWYEKAADQGYSDAQNALGDCYYQGIGVGRNYKAAFYWFKQAADQGDDQGQYNVGYCYMYGEGTDKDEQRGLYWLKQAADQGNASAQYQLGQCYSEGDGVTADIQEAKQWFEKAAGQGHEEAKKALAELKTTTTSQTTAQATKPAAAAAADDDAPKATAAEKAALKKFMAGMVGHTYQCSRYSLGEPLDYIFSTGGMQLVRTVKFISKTKATVSTKFNLNSNVSRMSPTAYQWKSELESSKFNYTGTVTTYGPYLVIKNPNGSDDLKFTPREGTLKLVTPGGNVLKKIK